MNTNSSKPISMEMLGGSRLNDRSSSTSSSSTSSGFSPEVQRRQPKAKQRAMIITLSAVVLLIILLVTLLPTTILWRMSINNLSNAAETSIRKTLNEYRETVVERVVSQLEAVLRRPANLAITLARQFTPVDKVFGNGTVYDLNGTVNKMLHRSLKSLAFPYKGEINDLLVAWISPDNCEHMFRILLYTPAFSLWDSCVPKMFTYFKYDDQGNPTTIPISTVNFTTVRTRPWYYSAFLSPDGLSWGRPFKSLTKGEGVMVSISHMFMNSSVQGVGAMGCSISILNSYLKKVKQSPNGWILLTEGDDFIIVGSSRTEFTNDTDIIFALKDIHPVVRLVVGTWVAMTEKQSSYSLMSASEGQLDVDTLPIKVQGSGVSFRLFM